MATLSLLWVAACASEPPVAPAEPEPAAGVETVVGTDVEATIVALENEWVDAIVGGDIETLDRLLADDFVGTSPSAHFFYKDMAIDDLQNGTYAAESMTLDEASANVYDGFAVAFMRDGQWQVVSSHGTRYGQSH